LKYSIFFIVPDDPEVEMDEETRALLTSDFEIGHYIRERIVPRAILYFTGKTLWGALGVFLH
jgi:nucleosome assembly protein 1-like 1